MSHPALKLKVSNITYAWLLLGQSKVDHIIKCMENWVLNPLLNLEEEFEDL